VGLGQREGDALVLADGPAEHHPLVAVGDGPLERDASDPDRLAGQEDALRVEAVEQVVEPPTDLADDVLVGHEGVVEGHLARHHGVAAHLRDRGDLDLRHLQVDEEQGHAVGALLHLVQGRGAGEEQALLRQLGLGVPDLAAPHAVAAVHLRRPGGDVGGVGAGVGLGDAEGHVEVAPHHPREVRRLHGVRAVLHHRVHPEHREVDGRAAVEAGPRRRDLLEHDRGLGDPGAAATELLRDGDAHPPGVRERLVERPRELVPLVAPPPVLVGEVRADAADGLPQLGVGLVGGHAVVQHPRSGRSPPRPPPRPAPFDIVRPVTAR
jgi:hypothetical protein